MLLLGITNAALLKQSDLPEKGSRNVPMQQFILCNTHLLFPHNEYSSKIRLREAAKILGFVESYRQGQLCSSICGRSDVKIPVVLTGDFNGSPRGSVFKYIKAQNFAPVLDSHSTQKWVSHKNHLDRLVQYDHIFYCNPSDQVEEKLPIVPDWTNLFFNEIVQKIVNGTRGVSIADIFSSFDSDGSNNVSRDEFVAGLQKLGFGGEGTPAVTDEEIDALISSADVDGDGEINFREFYNMILAAVTNSEQKGVLDQQKASALRMQWLTSNIKSASTEKRIEVKSSQKVPQDFSLIDTFQESPLAIKKVFDNTRPAGDFILQSVNIFPKDLESGIWPEDYELSDHGILETVFEIDCLPPYSTDEIIDPNPVAAKQPSNTYRRDGG
jgi:hypothetical protein